MSWYHHELDNSKQFEQLAMHLQPEVCRHANYVLNWSENTDIATSCMARTTSHTVTPIADHQLQVVQDCTVNTQSVPSRHSWCSNCKYILKTHCVLLSAFSAAFKPQSESHKKQRCSSGGFQCMSWTPSSRESCKHSLASSKWLSRTVRQAVSASTCNNAFPGKPASVSNISCCCVQINND